MLERVRNPPLPSAEEVRERRRRRRWRYALLLGGVAALAALATAAGWSVLFADRGEILYFSDEPLPGQSGRIAQHQIVHIDDRAALHERVDERTGAIIVPAERIDELGANWLAEQFAEGIVIVSIGDLSARELSQAIGVHLPGAATGVTRTAYAYIYRACEGSSAGGGSFGGPFMFEFFRLNLVNTLERDDLRC